MGHFFDAINLISVLKYASVAEARTLQPPFIIHTHAHCPHTLTGPGLYRQATVQNSEPNKSHNLVISRSAYEKDIYGLHSGTVQFTESVGCSTSITICVHVSNYAL